MKSNSALIVAIIDKSGSMSPLKAETVQGFGKFLDEQKRLPGEARMTLVQFDASYRLDYLNRPLSEIVLNYQPGGFTALLDAMGKAITDVGATLNRTPEQQRPAKVIVLVITDGAENASREYTRERVRDMVKHQQEKYAWEFVFLGANMDAVAEAGSLGIPAAFSANYAANPVGTQDTYSTISGATSRARTGKSSALTPEERAELDKSLKGTT